MKKFFFTILLSISLCFGKTALGINASTLNDLSPTNTIYTSQQVDQIANDISHEITFDYALKTNTIIGEFNLNSGTFTSTNYYNYEFILGDSSGMLFISPSDFHYTSFDGSTFGCDNVNNGRIYGVKSFDSGSSLWSFPQSTELELVFASTNMIPDVSGYVPWDNNGHNAITIGGRSGAVGSSSLVIGNQGNKSSATANMSFAMGEFCDSTGIGSFSIGYEADTSSILYGMSHGRYSLSSGNYAFANGEYVRAAGSYSMAMGMRTATSSSGDHSSGGTAHNYAFAWSGTGSSSDYYHSHGEGTFNIRPKPTGTSTDPASGFFIGESNLVQIVNALVDKRIAYAVENGITVNGTNYVLITENTLTNVLQNYHGQGF